MFAQRHRRQERGQAIAEYILLIGLIIIFIIVVLIQFREEVNQYTSKVIAWIAWKDPPPALASGGVPPPPAASPTPAPSASPQSLQCEGSWCVWEVSNGRPIQHRTHTYTRSPNGDYCIYQSNERFRLVSAGPSSLRSEYVNEVTGDRVVHLYTQRPDGSFVVPGQETRQLYTVMRPGGC